MSDDAIAARIRAMHPELTAIRRDIHAHPELGMEETRTAALVASTAARNGASRSPRASAGRASSRR